MEALKNMLTVALLAAMTCLVIVSVIAVIDLILHSFLTL